MIRSFERSFSVRKPSLVERAEVAGPEPAVAQRLRGRLRVAPVARHHRVAADDDLAGRADREIAAVAIDDAHFDERLRDADRLDPLRPARIGVVGEVRARERGDRHRRFALAVDLDEARAHRRQRAPDVLAVHRPAAVDDGLEAVARRAAGGDVVDEALHHRRRREQAEPADVARERDQLGRIEAARLGNDVARRARDEGQVVEPGAVRHRRGVDDRVGRIDIVDVDEVARGHRRQVAVRQHHALRPPGRPRGVEEPGEVRGRARRDGDRLGAERGLVRRRSGHEQRAQSARQRRDAVDEIVGHDHRGGLGVIDDVGDFLGVELGIDRHRGESGPPGRVQRLEIRRVVLHQQGDAVAGREAERAQMTREAGGAIGELAVAPERPPAVQQRRSIRMDARRARQKLSEIQAIVPGRSVGNTTSWSAPRAAFRRRLPRRRQGGRSGCGARGRVLPCLIRHRPPRPFHDPHFHPPAAAGVSTRRRCTRERARQRRPVQQLRRVRRQPLR